LLPEAVPDLNIGIMALVSNFVALVWIGARRANR